MSRVALFIEDRKKSAYAEEMSTSLRLPIVDVFPRNEFVLVLTTRHLELRSPDTSIKPIHVDFLSTSAHIRRLKGQGRSELIARAVGIKGQYFPKVLDATAGLGIDAMVLASLGCQVTMIERSPIVGALLQDGLKRAGLKLPKLVQHLSLHLMDAQEFLKTTPDSFDVIYLDPMFPARIKSSLVKKEMRIVKELVGEDGDILELFASAKQHAIKRIVVKRARFSPCLEEQEPDIVFKGKSSRFDVYLAPSFRVT